MKTKIKNSARMAAIEILIALRALNGQQTHSLKNFIH